MADGDHNIASEIVSKFLVDTCLTDQRINYDALEGLHRCIQLAARHPPDDNEVNVIPLTTGSVAELYIKPMLSCVDDVDIMLHRSDLLAIPSGYPPPTQLPGEFHRRVGVSEIIDSEFPGYVYLMSSYLLTECNDDGKYNAEQCPRRYTSYNSEYTQEHGPAFTGERLLISDQYIRRVDESQSHFDFVHCVRCLSWPSQAADWPTRQRNCGWPDSATVDRVVSNGCDVVPVAHHQCRQHEWMNKHQRRLSFSRAEITLLNSWMPVQQIVYHMLRVFVKLQRLPVTESTDNSGVKVISNYHIKTLMLWACELKPTSWWCDLNVIRISVELLHTLGVCLNNGFCQHYFISNCNLLHHPDQSLFMTLTVGDLMSITEVWLAEWFINNYIRKCAQLCPGTIARLFDDISTNVKLQNAVSAVARQRMIISVNHSLSAVTTAQGSLIRDVSSQPLTVQSCLVWMRELISNNQRLSLYFTACVFLHAAYKTSSRLLTDELLDVLATICLQSNDVRRCLNARQSSVLSLSQAAKLMKLIVNNSRSTVQLIEIELSKAYLYRALRCTDSDSDSIYCLADVYLAVLYYTTGQYQTAIDHCTLVTRSQDHSQCSSRVVQGELSPTIDHNIDSALGLTVLYQHLQSTALNQPHRQHVGVFSTELFAHYLLIKCLSVTRCHQSSTYVQSSDKILQYKICLNKSSELLITDVLVFRLPNNFTDKRQLDFTDQTRPVKTHQLDTSELVELLQQSAVEHLTTFRQIEAREFGRVYPVVTTDFEALYAYKRGEYQRCLQLSTHNVHTLISGPWSFGLVFMFPEFIQWLDDDIASLTGLTLLVNPKRRDEFKHFTITQLSFSLYLMAQSQIKLHHSVTSLAHILDYIQVARRHADCQLYTLDQLMLKLLERIVLKYVSGLYV